MDRIAPRLLASLLGLSSIVLRAPAPGPAEDGAGSVLRLSDLAGTVDIVRADAAGAFAGARNAPLRRGDELSTGANSRAEVEFPYGALLRAGAGTVVRFGMAGWGGNAARLVRGSVGVTLLAGTGARLEVDTPNAAIRAAGPGSYRVTVTATGETDVSVRSGQAAIVTRGGSESLEPGTALRLAGQDAATQIRTVEAERSADPGAGSEDAGSAPAAGLATGFTRAGVLGARDLERFGRWSELPPYGRVWYPGFPHAGWAPYHDGRWVWERDDGWTWIGAEPWGWAPYHYGRWLFAGTAGWCWIPGDVREYEPALVAFFAFGPAVGGLVDVGWVPLAPGEPFRPWWTRPSAAATATVLLEAQVVHSYTNIARAYRNARAPHGTAIVARTAFAAGTFGSPRSASANELARAILARDVVPVVPATDDLRFTGIARPGAPPAAARSFANERGEVARAIAREYPAPYRPFVPDASPAERPAGRMPATPPSEPVQPIEVQRGARAATPVEIIDGSASDVRRAVPVLQESSPQRSTRNHEGTSTLDYTSSRAVPKQEVSGLTSRPVVRPNGERNGASASARRKPAPLQARSAPARPENSEHMRPLPH